MTHNSLSRLAMSAFVLASAVITPAFAQEATTASPTDAVPVVPTFTNEDIDAMLRRVSETGDAEALAQLETLATGGSVRAQAILGHIYSRGGPVPVDGAKAVAFYEQALAAGNRGISVRLGVVLSDGVIVPADPVRALALFEEAAAEGNPYGKMQLGEALVRGSLGSPDVPRGLALLEEVREQGNPQAVVLLADLYSFGRGVPRNAPLALSMLTEAAEAGNPAAARSLIGIYRAGRGEEVPRDLAKAGALLAQYGPLLSDADRAFEDVMLAGARADGRADFAAFAEQANASPDGALSRMLPALHWVNPNAFVFLVQEKLAARGLYSGPLNGLMTGATIRAINALCRENGMAGRCAKGPMHGDTAKVLSELLN